MRATKKNCFICNKPIDTGIVVVEHRVVGHGVDVKGGPLENYHPDCAAKTINELRGYLSKALNDRDIEGNDICEFCNERIADGQPEVTVPTTVGFEHYHVIGGCAAKKISELEGNLKAVQGKESQTQEELDDF